MKIALVHDWLNDKRGGGEKVLLELAKLYPEAPVYTMLYNEDKFPELKGRVVESFLGLFPRIIRKRQRYMLPFVPAAIESFDFSEFDVVISSSCAFTKNIITGPDTLHICYCHSPARMFWDYWPRYIDEQKVGPLRRHYIRSKATEMRIWDHSGSDRVDVLIANSKTTQKRISKYYRRNVDILYPPVDLGACVYRAPEDKDNYFVTFATLTPYKRIDLAIEAFNISGKRLVIMSDGPDRKRLEDMAESNVEFAGYVSDEERTELLAGARALIYPNEEDFGIVPVETMAHGTPVIAFGKGGLTETVIDGETGLFFFQQSPSAINRAVEKFENMNFDGSAIKKRAQEFSSETFDEKILQLVKKAYQHHVETK